MMKNNISKEIVKRKNSDRPLIVSICGAADLGKSFLSKEISESLNSLNLKVAHLTLDSYLIDRKIRKEKGLSGYQTESYNMTNALNDLMTLKNGKPINSYPYDHKSGKVSLISFKMNSSDIIIFDGLHSMHSSFLPHIDMSIFIYTEDKQLKTIRREADLIKRNYNIEFSKRISKNELNSYKTNVEPYKNMADHLIFLESKWNYKLTITGYNNV